MRDLTLAIDDGSPILISTHDSWHYSVVFGYSSTHVFVMNPAVIGECGSLWCRLPKKEFLAEWDSWGIVGQRAKGAGHVQRELERIGDAERNIFVSNIRDVRQRTGL